MCDSPFYVEKNSNTANMGNPRNLGKFPVPCGRCPPCKKRKVQQWVFRMMQEEKVSESSHFITLTYNTDNVPISENGFMTLDKADWQKFMKRLRKRNTKKLRYYAVGEYGGKTDRPHYHAIIYNLDHEDLIAESWKIGTVHIGTVSGSSIAFTTKYIDKEKRIPMFERDDRLREFSLMSKGLGKNYINEKSIQ